MPLFNDELNRIADDIVDGCHDTVAPYGGADRCRTRRQRADHCGRRRVCGWLGGRWRAVDFDPAASGDVTNTAAFDFGTARRGAPGIVTHWSLMRGAAAPWSVSRSAPSRARPSTTETRSRSPRARWPSMAAPHSGYTEQEIELTIAA